MIKRLHILGNFCTPFIITARLRLATACTRIVEKNPWHRNVFPKAPSLIFQSNSSQTNLCTIVFCMSNQLSMKRQALISSNKERVASTLSLFFSSLLRLHSLFIRQLPFFIRQLSFLHAWISESNLWQRPNNISPNIILCESARFVLHSNKAACKPVVQCRKSIQ